MQPHADAFGADDFRSVLRGDGEALLADAQVLRRESTFP